MGHKSQLIVLQVGLWLVEINLSQYVDSFKSHNVDGQALLRVDGNRLKVSFFIEDICFLERRSCRINIRDKGWSGDIE